MYTVIQMKLVGRRALGTIAFVALSTLTLFAHAQEKYQLQIDNDIQTSKAETHQLAMQWIKQNFKVDNPSMGNGNSEMGPIVAKGNVMVELSRHSRVRTKFRLEIDVEENRYFARFNNVRVVYRGLERPIEMVGNKKILPEVDQRFQWLIEELHLHIRNRGQE